MEKPIDYFKELKEELETQDTDGQGLSFRIMQKRLEDLALKLYEHEF